MDPETQKRWDAWAESIARKVAQERALKLIEVIGPVIKDALAERDERIAALEQRVDDMEKAITGEEVIEWPLRTGTGG